ncbi:glutathione S-transferase [Pseudomonas sp. P115]|uniref:glutathione S-transferase family protein n=1 Tax=Pseudomonas pisciculturae TaxID=2730413 RepID=UPI001892478F|nr:glutathione S-transferase family protein [Pseudomonas pisciculturae]MBF6029290.1 glutathione S-transferase [Pseudomonas pisciculturae]
MKLFVSPTSPFARIVRILLREKNIPHEEIMVDPWACSEALMKANPACKVPVLVIDDMAISNSLCIAQYLESAYPDRTLPRSTPAELAQTALAFELIEAFASIIIGRRSLENFDESFVGLRRRDTLIEGLTRLNLNPPRYHGEGVPGMAPLVVTVLLDALRFRFGRADWMPDTPWLDELCQRLNQRPTFGSTIPLQP